MLSAAQAQRKRAPASAGPVQVQARVVLTFAEGEQPPSEFKLFTAGETAGTDGMKYFSDRSQTEVMTAFSMLGRELNICFGHDDIKPDMPSHEKRSGGGAWLEVRSGELWAVNVFWTPLAAQRIINRDDRYVSPLFLYDPKTLEIIEMISIALTADPGTLNPIPLMPIPRDRNLARSVVQRSRALEARYGKSLIHALGDAIREKFECGWIVDVRVGNLVVFEAYIRTKDESHLYQIAYTQGDDGVTVVLVGEPVEVEYVEDFVPTSPADASYRTLMALRDRAGDADAPMRVALDNAIWRSIRAAYRQGPMLTAQPGPTATASTLNAAVLQAFETGYPTLGSSEFFYVYLEAFIDTGTAVIYCSPIDCGESKLYQVGFIQNADHSVTLTSQPVEVEAQTSYIPVADPGARSSTTGEEKRTMLSEAQKQALLQAVQAGNPGAVIVVEQGALYQSAEGGYFIVAYETTADGLTTKGDPIQVFMEEAATEETETAANGDQAGQNAGGADGAARSVDVAKLEADFKVARDLLSDYENKEREELVSRGKVNGTIPGKLEAIMRQKSLPELRTVVGGKSALRNGLAGRTQRPQPGTGTPGDAAAGGNEGGAQQGARSWNGKEYKDCTSLEYREWEKADPTGFAAARQAFRSSRTAAQARNAR